MSYYENSQWSAGGQTTWEHQTPPARSGASSTVPREEAAAFVSQIEEVEKAIDNLVKSGKMFTVPGRHNHNRMPSGPSSRPHSVGGFEDARGPHQGSNLSNFYANQRHQSSRGSNEAEQMMQAKRRMAAQRERELRNYHQEQQYNRTAVLSDMSSYNKPDRTLSPGSNMSEDERRELIARQRSALYGEGLRGPSPLAYEYGRTPSSNQGDAQSQQQQPQGPGAPEGSQAAMVAANDRSRANSNASPLSNAGSRAAFDAPPPQSQQSQQGGAPITRASTSSPNGSPSNNKQSAGGAAVAPIGTRPSGAGSPSNPALANKQRSTTPLPSPLSHGYSASSTGNGDDKSGNVGSSNTPQSATAGPESGNVGISGWGGRPGVWGNKSGLGSVQASVWG
ncbi:hypothetical protein, variant [Gaeumannomyces tritici R3-111a-1]|uniref:Uncharacterized protein n=1 Tax=Gaeumannomyces tritici (strain R3-111a-1) TaxID=644352 RepID=J3PER6_GAET3|nr:hypothetical protein, variant [Gaeumannomyces tritici R3-111a-1]EJT70973.1 hypothetical protein, variant [Gaeumannomyces tritici R3-111a-1]